MMRTRRRAWLWVAIALVLIVLVSGGCGGNVSSSFEGQFNTIVQPYSFNLLTWEISTLFNDVRQKVFHAQPEDALTSQNVMHYFSYAAQLNTLKSDLKMLQAKKIQGDIDQYESKINEFQAQIDTQLQLQLSLKPVVEQTISRQISETLAEQGIYNPVNSNWFHLTFPPIDFTLEKPLYLLVVSSRDKIERVRGDITIKPDINTAQMEELESSLAKLGVSSLVVQIGGLGATYPTFVVNNADLRFTINTAVEEWLHQYLSFKPLGIRYVLDLLGISHYTDIATLNETVAGVASQEIGQLVYERYYAQYETKTEPKASVTSASASSAPVFDFNAFMRETRLAVDAYLKLGQADEAEKYMEARRQTLITKGYYIRKINQAYFAFHGSYAYGPGSVDPIGDQVQSLRSHSPSIKDFIDSASQLTSRDDLVNIVNGYGK
jgi:hypothetical protein